MISEDVVSPFEDVSTSYATTRSSTTAQDIFAQKEELQQRRNENTQRSTLVQSAGLMYDETDTLLALQLKVGLAIQIHVWWCASVPYRVSEA